jgi:ferredoxin
MESILTTIKSEYGLESTPVYNRLHCQNCNAFGEACHRCVDVCPEKIFVDTRSKKPDFTNCVKCGACVAVCPSGAITPIDTKTRVFMMAIGKNDVVNFGCERDDESWSVQYDCLVSLSWEQIAIAALNKGAIISIRKCVSCENKVCYEKIIEAITKTKSFLGDKLFFDRVEILNDGDKFEPKSTEISRRELFTFYKRLPLNRAIELLPEHESGDNMGLFYRAILRDMIRKEYENSSPEERRKYVVTLPRFTEKCNGCDMCRRQCPEKALKITKSNDKSTVSVTVDVWKCTSCGVCAKACREKAISGYVKMAVPHLDTVLIAKNVLLSD